MVPSRRSKSGRSSGAVTAGKVAAGKVASGGTSARSPRGGASPVSITFLGGLGEIGRNCAAIEQDGSILLIDCGLMFPDNDMLGVDLVLPDFTW